MLIRAKLKTEVESSVDPLRTIGMRKMCQSRQFVVTLEECQQSTVCHIRLRLLLHGRLRTLRFSDVVFLVLLLRRFAVIVSQINHGKANVSNNGYYQEIPYNTDNIASLPTEENHITIHTACSTTLCKTVNQKHLWFTAIGSDKNIRDNRNR